MKRIYAFGLILTMLLGLGFKASALKVTLEWETPGSVYIQTQEGMNSKEDVALSPDQTSFDFSSEASWGYVYVYASDGYYLGDASLADDPDAIWRPVGYGNNPKYISLSIGNALDGKTVKIVSKKLDRDDVFTLDLVNGEGFISAQFASGYVPVIKNGENKINFNADYDQTLSLTLENVAKAYSVTLDGTEVEINQYYPTYPNIAVADGSMLKVQVFESEDDIPQPATVKLEFSDGTEKCITNIRNITSNQWYYPAQLENNTFEAMTGNELQFNFNTEDYVITGLTLNGKDIFDTYVISTFNGTGIATFTIPETENVVKVEATAREWGTIDFTAYLVNADGIEFTNSYYNGEAYELTDAETLTSDVKIGNTVFPAGQTQKVTISVPEKQGQFFFGPKEGYYLSAVYNGFDEDNIEEHNSSASINAEYDGTIVYMYANKIPEAYTAKLNVKGTDGGYAFMTSSNPYADMWKNPSGFYQYVSGEGEQEITFRPGYDTPITLSSYVDSESGNKTALYLDGAEVNGYVNSESGALSFTFTPYSPTEENTVAGDPVSVIEYYNSLTERPTMSGASLELGEGAEAEFFYSPVMRVADPEGQAVISGTQMTVRPVNPNMPVSYKGEAVELDENGEYTFIVTGNARNNVVKVEAASSEAKTFQLGVDPADGATVKSLTKISITLPMEEIDPTYETQPWLDMEKLMEFGVYQGTEQVGFFGGMDEPTGDEYGNMIMPIILAEPITESGEYTIQIPEGTFYQAQWDDDMEDWTPVPNGAISVAYTGKLTVDPNMAGPLETIVLTPTSGSVVKEIDEVNIAFPSLSYGTMFDGWEFPEAVFTNGTETVYGEIGYNWWAEDCLTMYVQPVEDLRYYDYTSITTPGKWTMTIAANTFTMDGEGNKEIVAEFIVDPTAPVYQISPAHGSTTNNLSKITITFPGVEEVEYTEEEPITLEGPEYNAISFDVTGIGNSRTVTFRNPNVDGEYTVTFPAGAFLLDGEDSEECVAKFNFESGWVLTPASGTVLEKFEGLTLSFPNATEAEYVGSSYDFIFRGSSWIAPGFEVEKVEDAEVPTFFLTLQEGSPEPPVDYYSLRIDEGVFMVDGVPSGEITASYQIDHESSTEYTLSPEDKIILQDHGFEAAIIFDETATLTYPDRSKINLYLDEIEMTAQDYSLRVEANMLMFSVTGADFKKTGTFMVTIEEGAFNIGKTPVPAIDAEWEVVEPKTFTMVVTPMPTEDAPFVNDLSKITVEFPEAETGEVWLSHFVSLRSANYSYYKTASSIEEVEAEEGVKFEITFDPAPTEKGEYTLAITTGAFTLDGTFESPEVQVVYNFDPSYSAIGGFFADENGNVTVVTIDGRVVLNNVPAAQLRELEKGIYIINGKKTMVK